MKRLKDKLAYLVALFITSCTLGCSGLPIDRASSAADDVVSAAEFTLCRAITVGAWSRAYGQSAERAEAWRRLCSVTVSQTPK